MSWEMGRVENGGKYSRSSVKIRVRKKLISFEIHWRIQAIIKEAKTYTQQHQSGSYNRTPLPPSPNDMAIGLVWIVLGRRSSRCRVVPITSNEARNKNVPTNPSLGGGQSLSSLHGRKVDLINRIGQRSNHGNSFFSYDVDEEEEAPRTIFF
jgi:hypothetical protein